MRRAAIQVCDWADDLQHGGQLRGPACRVLVALQRRRAVCLELWRGAGAHPRLALGLRHRLLGVRPHQHGRRRGLRLVRLHVARVRPAPLVGVPLPGDAPLLAVWRPAPPHVGDAGGGCLHPAGTADRPVRPRALAGCLGADLAVDHLHHPLAARHHAAGAARLCGEAQPGARAHHHARPPQRTNEAHEAGCLRPSVLITHSGPAASPSWRSCLQGRTSPNKTAGQ
mmetsp:Transcript_18554/g.46615  ORF Transcript_18554/g.46615 Transcript_18554/m.46615 type:complete len:226 (+) Transcript_18554:219-896(+)